MYNTGGHWKSYVCYAKPASSRTTAADPKLDFLNQSTLYIWPWFHCYYNFLSPPSIVDVTAIKVYASIYIILSTVHGDCQYRNIMIALPAIRYTEVQYIETVW